MSRNNWSKAIRTEIPSPLKHKQIYSTLTLSFVISSDSSIQRARKYPEILQVLAKNQVSVAIRKLWAIFRVVQNVLTHIQHAESTNFAKRRQLDIFHVRFNVSFDALSFYLIWWRHQIFGEGWTYKLPIVHTPLLETLKISKLFDGIKIEGWRYLHEKSLIAKKHRSDLTSSVTTKRINHLWTRKHKVRSDINIIGLKGTPTNKRGWIFLN